MYRPRCNMLYVNWVLYNFYTLFSKIRILYPPLSLLFVFFASFYFCPFVAHMPLACLSLSLWVVSELMRFTSLCPLFCFHLQIWIWTQMNHWSCLHLSLDFWFDAVTLSCFFFQLFIIGINFIYCFFITCPVLYLLFAVKLDVTWWGASEKKKEKKKKQKKLIIAPCPLRTTQHVLHLPSRLLSSKVDL